MKRPNNIFLNFVPRQLFNFINFTTNKLNVFMGFFSHSQNFTKFEKVILRFVGIKVFYFVLYPVFFNSKNGRGDRLHHPLVYSAELKRNRDVLRGFDRSFFGKILAKRNQNSAKLKQQLLIDDAGISNEDKAVIGFTTRSWHFLNPLIKVFEESDKFDAIKIDVNDFDQYLLDKGIGSPSILKKSRVLAWELNRQINRWNLINLREAELLQNAVDAPKITKCDIYFVEWLNQNTIWALCHLPKNKRIIVRVHSYEAFSYFSAVIDFGRIECLIFISHAIKDAFVELWGWIIPPDIKIVVLDNIRNKERLGDNSKGLLDSKVRRWSLGMVQYSDEVKDLQFALRVFESLRRRDARYTLHLAGKPILDQENNSFKYIQKLKMEFGENSIIIHGYVTDIGSFYKSIGHILSTSMREGSHESIIEGLYFGCIPAIRNWPLLASYSGAKKAFPDYEIFDREYEMENWIIRCTADFDKLSVDARSHSERYFDKQNAAKYIDLVTELLK